MYTRDLTALADHAVGHLEIHGENPCDGCPASNIVGGFALLHQSRQDAWAILLDTGDVLEITLSLLFEDSMGE